jgi:predicted transcriptional regulator
MARKKSPVLTDGERRIMEILWRRGEAPVKDIVDALSAEAAVANATVHTMLKILETKGYAKRRKVGRAFLYAPTVSKAEARRGALAHIVAQFFDGSPEVLAQHLIRDSDLDLAKLEEIERRLDEDGEA